jgi:hypothetical protein
MPVIHLISSWLNCFSTIDTIYKNLSVQNKFIKLHIRPILTDALKTNDGSLEPSDLTKITSYYGLAVPAILGEAFCLLHGKKMTPNERWASTAQGAMTGLFDDFFDKEYLPKEKINQLMQPGDPGDNTKSNEKLFSLFYKKVLDVSVDPAAVQNALKLVYDAQVESKKQLEPAIRETEIELITFFKGGTSLLFYRTVFSPAINIQEEKLLYSLGGLMQLCNDIFDVYKDRESQVKTLVTETKHIALIREQFQVSLSTLFEMAYRCDYPHERVRKFLSVLSLGIFSRALVCLDQLHANEMTTGGQFMVGTYSRAALICDMDTAKNKIRSLRYHRMLMKKS